MEEVCDPEQVERHPMSDVTIIPGCEPMSHTGTREAGVLVLHGFTGNPSSMRQQADAFAELGYHVELPRLPGHGTSLDDMLPTRWADWTGEVEVAYQRLAARADKIVVMGLSMGGSLTLWTGLQHPGIAGLVLVNAAAMPQPDDVVAMLQEMVDEGNTFMPGIGSDIADSDVTEIAYEGTPLLPLLSLQNDGVATMVDRYGELQMPVLIYTSHNDHVVPPASSEHIANTVGGDVEHVWLDRSFHVATQDFDRDDITAGAAAFIGRVTGA
jgi:carboxylesterase